MASSWQSTVEGAETFSVEEQVRNRIDSRGERGKGRAFGGFGNDIVGINAEKVPEMQNQIRDSVSVLQNKIDAINAAADQSKAFRSDDVQTAVKEYIEKVKAYCGALISDLLSFNDKLQVVRNAWMSSSRNFAENQVKADGNQSFSDNTAQYQEKFVSGK